MRNFNYREGRRDSRFSLSPCCESELKTKKSGVRRFVVCAEFVESMRGERRLGIWRQERGDGEWLFPANCGERENRRRAQSLISRWVLDWQMTCQLIVCRGPSSTAQICLPVSINLLPARPAPACNAFLILWSGYRVGIDL